MSNTTRASNLKQNLRNLLLLKHLNRSCPSNQPNQPNQPNQSNKSNQKSLSSLSKSKVTLSKLIFFIAYPRFLIFLFICCGLLYNSNIHADTVRGHKIIAITQIVEHPALDAVREGVLEKLKQKGYIEGQNLTLIYENAQGNMALTSQISNKILSEPLDIAVAISTPSAQSLLFTAVRMHKDLPIVYAAVTDPNAAKLIPGNQHYPITGVTDAPNLEGVIEVMHIMLPNLKTLGVMYNPAETNSVSTVQALRVRLQKEGIAVREVTVNSTNDVGNATQSLVGKVDALYFPQDNTVVAAIEAVIKAANQSSARLPVILPIFTNDPVLVKKGVLAAVGYDYRDIGRETADIVVEILDGKNATEIPAKNPDNLKTVINKDLADKLGLTIPKNLKNSTIEVLR